MIAFGEKKIRSRSGAQPLSPAAARLAGALLAVFTVAAAMAAVALISGVASFISPVVWFIASVYLTYSAICLKDLYFQTWRVEKALAGGFVDEARQRLAWVVGRDTANLDDVSIRRALTETLAENLSDGLVAPMFYLALGGPILAWGYKAVNTLDSMIGYRSERYVDLGRFAAKLDDAANFIPARLSALLLVLSARLQGYDWRCALAAWRRDGRLHDSPNSGQPEAAMAGALGVWLGGPGYYCGLRRDKPVICAGGREAAAETVRAAENLMVGAAILMLALCIAVMSLLTGRLGWM
jgi:adenosylcobinamide-phosphate synthase